MRNGRGAEVEASRKFGACEERQGHERLLLRWLLLLVRLRQPRRRQVRGWLQVAVGQREELWMVGVELLLLGALLGQRLSVPLQRERAEPLLLLHSRLRPFWELELLPLRRGYSSRDCIQPLALVELTRGLRSTRRHGGGQKTSGGQQRKA